MFPRKSRNWLLSGATIAVAVTLLAACGAGPGTTPGGAANGSGDSDQLVFAAIPVQGTDQLKASFAPIVSLLEKKLDRDIAFKPVTSNAAVIEGQVAQRVDIAVYGALSYYLARSRADIEPVAAPIDSPGNDPGATGYGIVRADERGISSLKDVVGKNICFTDPTSTTGHLAPLAALLKAGINPSEKASVTFTGGHDTSVSALLAGDCDIAFVGEVFVDRLLPKRGVLEPGQVRKVWTTQTLPAPPVAVGTWLPEQVRIQIQQALTARNAAEMAKAGFCAKGKIKGPAYWGDKQGVTACPLGASHAWKFASVSDSDYQPIARICEITNAKVCTTGE